MWFIYPDLDHDYYWSDNFSCKFFIVLAKAGFITIGYVNEEVPIILPQLQTHYALLEHKDLHISHHVKKLLQKSQLPKKLPLKSLLQNQQQKLPQSPPPLQHPGLSRHLTLQLPGLSLRAHAHKENTGTGDGYCILKSLCVGLKYKRVLLVSTRFFFCE